MSQTEQKQEAKKAAIRAEDKPVASQMTDANTTATAYEIAREAGYTVHGPEDEFQGWAYCIDGDYSNDEYDSEDAAWEAAADEVRRSALAKAEATC